MLRGGGGGIPEGMWMLLTSGRCEYLRRWAGEAGEGGQGAAEGQGLQELPFLPLSPWLLLAFCSWRSSFQEQGPPSKLTWCQRPNIGRAGQLLESLSTQVELQISRSHCSTAFKVDWKHKMWIPWYVRIFMKSVVILFSIAMIVLLRNTPLQLFLCICPRKLLLKFLSLSVFKTRSFSAVPIHCKHFLSSVFDP